MTISTNESWKKLFDELEIHQIINEQGVFNLTSKEIKGITQKEPRLMCKFDHRESRPEILRRNNYTILSIKNGYYAIFDGDGYADTQTNNIITPYFSPRLNSLETIPKVFRSESQVIDAVYASGIFEDFIGEGDLPLTIRGRLRSKPFDFSLNTPKGILSFDIDGVQIEVDSGYEGDKVYLIEAKMGETDNFHMRQLYYPYRMWKEEGLTKEIIPIFLYYYDGIVSLTQYEFTNDDFYDSYCEVQSKQYSFESEPIVNSLEDILAGIALADTSEMEDVPFPQANDLKKVRDVINLIYSGINSRDAIAAYWDIEGRQGDYYANAARYLGFVERENQGWALTEMGCHYLELPTSRRKRCFVEAILKRTVFYKLATIMFEEKNIPDNQIIKSVIIMHTGVSDNTAGRRSSTVKSWLQFIERYFE